MRTGSFMKELKFTERLDRCFLPFDKALINPSLITVGPESNVLNPVSTKALGIRATCSLLPKNIVADIHHQTVASGDRIITSRYAKSFKSGEKLYKINVYDLMTDFVIFTVRHRASYPFKLFASSRLLVVVENYKKDLPYVSKPGKGATTMTVYERINDAEIVKSVATAKANFKHVIISQDNSVIAFIRKHGQGAFIYIKERGHLGCSEVDVYLGDKWIILHKAPPHDREVSTWKFETTAIKIANGAAKRLFDNLNVVLQVSGNLLTWANKGDAFHVVQMLDLDQEVLCVKTLGLIPRFYFLDTSLLICPFGDFKKTGMMTAIGAHGAVAILRFDVKAFTFACPTLTFPCCTIPSPHSPLILRTGPYQKNSSNPFPMTAVIRLKSSLTPDIIEGPTWHATVRAMFFKKIMSLDGQLKSSFMARYKGSVWHAKIHKRFIEKATPARILYIILQYLPAPAAFPRWTIIPTDKNFLCAFDEGHRHRYLWKLDESEIRRTSIYHDYLVGTMALVPYKFIQGKVQHFKVNSSGGVFYLATVKSVKIEGELSPFTAWFVYVIDAVYHSVYECRLSRFVNGATIIRIEPFDDRVLAVTLKSKKTLILVYQERRKLCLLRILSPRQKLCSASRYVAIIEDRRSAGKPRMCSLDLTKEYPFLKNLETPDTKFIALGGTKVYFLSHATSSENAHRRFIMSFDFRSLETVYIREYREPLEQFVISQVHNEYTIRFIDKSLRYRIRDTDDFRPLSSTFLPELPDSVSFVSLSTQGYRVALYNSEAIHIFDLFDMGLSLKELEAKKPAHEKPPRPRNLYNSKKCLINNLPPRFPGSEILYQHYGDDIYDDQREVTQPNHDYDEVEQDTRKY